MRLRHSNAYGRGYRRVAAGTGFSYRDLDGSTLPPGPIRDRLESIGIPPAWTDVWIAPFENGHIQATGLDAVGRRQYIYHPEWRERKDRREVRPRPAVGRVAAGRPPAGHHGPAQRRRRPRTRPGSGLQDAGQRIVAGGVRAVHQRERQPRPCHPPVRPRPGAQGLPAAEVSRPRAARTGNRRSTTPTSPPWCGPSNGAGVTPGCWRTRTAGAWHPVTSADINAYVKERTGSDFTAKDFRTLRGTVAAAVSLARTGPQKTVGRA